MKKEKRAHHGVDTRFWGNKMPELGNILPEGWDNHMKTQQLCRKSVKLEDINVEFRNRVLVYVIDITKEDFDFLRTELVKETRINFDKCHEHEDLCVEETENFLYRKSEHPLLHWLTDNPCTVTDFSQNLALTKYFQREARSESIPVYTEKVFNSLAARMELNLSWGGFTVQAAILRIKE